jgi:hypothetical protein
VLAATPQPPVHPPWDPCTTLASFRATNPPVDAAAPATAASETDLEPWSGDDSSRCWRRSAPADRTVQGDSGSRSFTPTVEALTEPGPGGRDQLDRPERRDLASFEAPAAGARWSGDLDWTTSTLKVFNPRS